MSDRLRIHLPDHAQFSPPPPPQVEAPLHLWRPCLKRHPLPPPAPCRRLLSPAAGSAVKERPAGSDTSSLPTTRSVKSARNTLLSPHSGVSFYWRADVTQSCLVCRDSPPLLFGRPAPVLFSPRLTANSTFPTISCENKSSGRRFRCSVAHICSSRG